MGNLRLSTRERRDWKALFIKSSLCYKLTFIEYSLYVWPNSLETEDGAQEWMAQMPPEV